MANNPPPAAANIQLTPAFKLIFLSVLGLTILFAGLTVVLLFAFPSPSADAKNVMNVSMTLWQMGFGAIVGLIGGKAT